MKLAHSGILTFFVQLLRLGHCCTCAANITKGGPSRRKLKHDSASHVLPVMDLVTGITDKHLLSLGQLEVAYLSLPCFRDAEKFASHDYSWMYARTVLEPSSSQS